MLLILKVEIVKNKAIAIFGETRAFYERDLRISLILFITTRKIVLNLEFGSRGWINVVHILRMLHSIL